MTVQDEVIDVIGELGLDISNISSETRFVEDLGVNSLDQVELLMELEEWFDIIIPDGDAESLTTVGAVVKYVEENAC